MCSSRSVDIPVFVRFFARPVRYFWGKVFVGLDSHSVHEEAASRRWVEWQRDKSETFFLALGRGRPATRTQMADRSRWYVLSVLRRPDVVEDCFHDEVIRYSA